jgi:hypothetical protein
MVIRPLHSVTAPRAINRRPAGIDSSPVKSSPDGPTALVVHGFSADDHAEETGKERDRGTRARPETWVEHSDADEQAEWHESAHEMVRGRRTRIRL